MPTYNIIGDIHGQDSWKRLVDEDCINIFVGDYFDPYQDFTVEELERNFMEIVEYKRKHRKNTVLLYGNHDMDYLPGISERNNRYDEENAFWIQQLFTASEWLFHGVAFAICDGYLVTHAGVTKEWKETYLPGARSIRPANMAKAINSLWKKDKRPFTFDPNSNGFDYSGNDPRHSPLWVRPESLCLDNLYDGTSVKQIVGHTRVKEICEVAGVILVDCLDMTEKSYKVTCP